MRVELFILRYDALINTMEQMSLMSILSRTQKQLLPHISRIFSASSDSSQFRFVYLASFLAFMLLNVWMVYITPKSLALERMNVLSSPFSSAQYMLLGKHLYALGDVQRATVELRLAEQMSTVLLPFASLTPRVLGTQSEPIDTIHRWEQEQTYVYRAYAYWHTVIQKYPDYRDAYLTLAGLCIRMDNTNEAILYINKAYALDPNNEIVGVLAKQLGVTF